MPNSDAELEKEAEELETQAKEEMANKNYDLALLLLMDAKDIYLQIGFKGQIGIIEKQIKRIENLMEFEEEAGPSSSDLGERKNKEAEANRLLEKAKNLSYNKFYEDALKAYERARELFEELGYNYQAKQIIWETNKIKDFHLKPMEKGELKESNSEGEDLTIAQKRQLRIQKQMEEKQTSATPKQESSFYLIQKKKKEEQEAANKTEGMRIREKLIRERPDKPKTDYLDKKVKLEQEKAERLRQIQEKKKKQQDIINKAETYLTDGKAFLDQKQFEEAKQHYKKAIQYFSELGWKQQVEVLNTELKNIDKYEQQHKEKMKEEFIKKKKREKEFQERVNVVLAEKKKAEDERLAKLRALPPEIQNKIKRARDALQKAEKEQEMSKLKRALGRYEYALELYKSITTDKIDLSKDITETENKITQLKSKL